MDYNYVTFHTSIYPQKSPEHTQVVLMLKEVPEEEHFWMGTKVNNSKWKIKPNELDIRIKKEMHNLAQYRFLMS